MRKGLKLHLPSGWVGALRGSAVDRSTFTQTGNVCSTGLRDCTVTKPTRHVLECGPPCILPEKRGWIFCTQRKAFNCWNFLSFLGSQVSYSMSLQAGKLWSLFILCEQAPSLTKTTLRSRSRLPAKQHLKKAKLFHTVRRQK